MNYMVRLAEETDIAGLCQIRNNEQLFLSYLSQQVKKEAYLVVAIQQELILGFGVLKLKGPLVPKLSDLYVKESM